MASFLFLSLRWKCYPRPLCHSSAELLALQNEKTSLEIEVRKQHDEEIRIREAQRHNDLFEEAIGYLRAMKSEHHNPIMSILQDVSTKLVLLSEVLRYLLPGMFHESKNMSPEDYADLSNRIDAIVNEGRITINTHVAGGDLKNTVGGDMTGGTKS